LMKGKFMTFRPYLFDVAQAEVKFGEYESPIAIEVFATKVICFRLVEQYQRFQARYSEDWREGASLGWSNLPNGDYKFTKKVGHKLAIFTLTVSRDAVLIQDYSEIDPPCS